MEKRMRAGLAVFVMVLFFLQAMTIIPGAQGTFSASEDQETLAKEDMDEIAMIHTGGDPSESLLEEVSVIEDYDNFLLVETSEERLERFKEEGKFLGRPENTIHAPGGNFEMTETLKDEGWKIESYEGEGLYLVDFIGPIKESWKRNIRELDGKIYGSPGDVYRVKIDSSEVDNLNGLDEVNTVKPYHQLYKVEDELYDGIKDGSLDEKVTLEMRLTKELKQSELKRKLSRMNGLLLSYNEGSLNANSAEIILDSSEIQKLAREPDILNIYEENEYQLWNDDASWVLQSYDTTPDHAKPLWEHGIYGQNQVVGASDTGIDYDHAMFRDTKDSAGTPGPDHRKVIYYNEYANGDDTDNSGHGTHVTGSIAGDWETYGEPDDHDGMAPAAQLAFYDIGDDNDGLSLPDLTTMFQNQYDEGARIMSNSWGSGDSSYSGDAGLCDEFMWNHEDALIMFANGNAGPNPNTVGEPATAKSIVSVGAAVHEESEDMTDFSSRGPTDDGRQKPTIVAPGESIVSADSDGDLSTLNDGLISMQGTSMATPLTAGLTSLARQYYADGWYPTGQENSGDGFNPSGSLMKATLINSAWNMEGYGTNGSIPSIGQGWGKVNLDNTLYFEGDERNMEILNGTSGFSSSGEEHSYNVYAGDDQELKVTLTWTDFPDGGGAINNDLDLIVEAPDGTTYYGNNFENGHSVSGGSANRTEPHEQVLLDLPDMQEGKYTVRVVADTIESGPQKYALLSTGDLVNSRGSVEFEHEKYNMPPVNDFVDVRVKDTDLNGDPNTQESVDITVSSTTESTGETWTLTETGPDTGIFEASIELDTGDPADDGLLQVSKGDTLTAEYSDASHSVTRTAYSEIDATAPEMSDVRHPSIPPNRLVVDAASVEWETNEESYGRIDYGKTPQLGQKSIEENSSYNHTLVMTELEPNTTYYYRLVSTDLSHGPNVAIDDNDGALYTFRTPNWPVEMGVGYTGYVYNIDGTTGSIFNRDLTWTGYYYYQTIGPASEGPFESVFMFNSSHIAGRSLDSATLNLFNNGMYRNTAGSETWRFEVLPDSVESTFPGPTYADVGSDNVNAQFEIGTKTTSELAGAEEGDVLDFSGNLADLENNMGDGRVVVRAIGDFTTSEYFLNSWFSGHNTTKDTWHLMNPQIRTQFSSPSKGDIAFDKSEYGVSDFAHIYLDDDDLNTDPDTKETASVTVTSQTTGDSEDLTLTETTTNSSQFHNKIEIVSGSASANDGLLQVQAGETIEVAYADANPSGTRTDTAVIDDTPPTISNVASTVNGVDATITWDTDEDSTSKVYYGGSTSLGAEKFNESLVTGHSVDLSGLAENTQYYFKVESTDISGNTAVDDNGGSLYTFTTGTGTVTDDEGPVVGNLSYSPNNPEWGTTTTFEGVADDSVKGGSNIDSVEYFIDLVGDDGEGTLMDPKDGAFDSSIEDFTADITTSDLSEGTHIMYIHALDTSGNWGSFGDIEFNVSSNVTNTAPTVDLTRPDGGETFSSGTTETIWWNMSDSQDPNTDLTVDLYYSNDTGTSWNVIQTGIAGTADPNSYDWTVPDDPSTNCLVKVDVTDTHGTNSSDKSQSTFTIESTNSAPSVNLTRPDGGETFIAGDTETIWWNMSDSEDANTDLTVDLYYSNDTGSNWNVIQTGMAGAGNPNSYDWLVPEDPSTNCLVRVDVTDTNGATSSNQSQSTFTIEAPNSVPSVDLTRPDGGETFIAGSTETIWWNMSDSEDANTDLTVDLYYSNDTGSNWNVIQTGMAGSGNPNSYDWLVPDDPSTNSLVRVDVTDTNGATSSDVSNNTFTIDLYQLTIDSTAGGNVTVPGEGTFNYTSSEVVNLEAVPDSNYSFIEWTGDNSTIDNTSANSTSITMEGNYLITAEFSKDFTTFIIDLYSGGEAEGWNFVSFPLISSNTSLVEIIENSDDNISGNYDKVMYYDAKSDEWGTYVPGRADHYNNIETWNHSMGIWIQMNQDDTLTIVGDEPNNTTVNLQPGWNMLGMPINSTDNGSNLNIPTEVSKVGYFNASYGNNLNYTADVANFQFEPGEGYWIYNDAQSKVTWTIPY
ncbi:MAG: S8 family serine peptidase [Candidatus Thermoplasmatota archaeon]|nr:S8 family serine peptidase [Candidatus Thermoplasmatota archaeon]